MTKMGACLSTNERRSIKRGDKQQSSDEDENVQEPGFKLFPNAKRPHKTKSLEDLLNQFEPVKNWLAWTQDLSWTRKLEPLKPVKSFRIASWNLNRLSLGKIRNPGYLEAICLSILRADIDAICLQELAHPDVAKFIADELNKPSLPHVKEFTRAKDFPMQRWLCDCPASPTGQMYRSKEYGALIYNECSGLSVGKSGIFETSRSASEDHPTFTRSPLMFELKVFTESILLVSLHLKYRGLRNSQTLRTQSEVQHLAKFSQAFFDTHSSPRRHLVLLGDFNLQPSHEAFQNLRDVGMWPVLDQDEATSTYLVRTSSKTTAPGAYDNAWLSSTLAQKQDGVRFTGCKGVVLETMQHPLIAHDDGWNGFASDHCLIWFDLATQW